MRPSRHRPARRANGSTSACASSVRWTKSARSRASEKPFRRHAILRTILEPAADGGSDAADRRRFAGGGAARRRERRRSARACRSQMARPAIRISLQRIGDGERLLRLRCHRSLADGATVRMLLGEIGALYANGLEGMELFPLLDRALSYADYAALGAAMADAGAAQRPDGLFPPPVRERRCRRRSEPTGRATPARSRRKEPSSASIFRRRRSRPPTPMRRASGRRSP